jgi:ketosteroid isomerase-like protein
MATRKRAKSASKPRARRPAKRAARSVKPSIEAVARKIVRATQRPDFPFVTLYAPDCTSAEPRGEPARGHAGIEEKSKRWAQMQLSTQWTARNVWTGKNTVCIEWDGEVQLRDGRHVSLREIAVHEIKDGKIHHERFYYDPSALAPAPAAQ